MMVLFLYVPLPYFPCGMESMTSEPDHPRIWPYLLSSRVPFGMLGIARHGANSAKLFVLFYFRRLDKLPSPVLAHLVLVSFPFPPFLPFTQTLTSWEVRTAAPRNAVIDPSMTRHGRRRWCHVPIKRIGYMFDCQNLRWYASCVIVQKLLRGYHGYSYEWTDGRIPCLIKHGVQILCNTENFVPIVVPSLSTTSSSPSPSATPISLPQDSTGSVPISVSVHSERADEQERRSAQFRTQPKIQNQIKLRITSHNG